jgi:hypothetical protein
LKGGLQDLFAGGFDPLDKAAARAKFEAVRAAPRRLAEERREAFLTEYRIREQRVRAGTDTPDASRRVSRSLLDAELALAGGRGDRLATLERYWARADELEALTRERVEAGVKNFTPADLYAARFDRLQAELWLAQARAGKE